MTLKEKTAYLKGLMDGLNTDDKVVSLMADILTDIAAKISDMEDDIEDIAEAVDTIDEDLGDLEKDYYEIDEDDDDDDDGCCGGNSHHFDEDFDDEDEEDEELFDDEELYEVTCPTCQDTICLNEAMIEEGSITCPNCGELLEFDIDDTDEESPSEE